MFVKITVQVLANWTGALWHNYDVKHSTSPLLQTAKMKAETPSKRMAPLLFTANRDLNDRLSSCCGDIRRIGPKNCITYAWLDQFGGRHIPARYRFEDFDHECCFWINMLLFFRAVCCLSVRQIARSSGTVMEDWHTSVVTTILR